MRSNDPRGSRRRCRRHPIVEGLEVRQLPSSSLASALSSLRPPLRRSAAIVAHPDSPNGLLGKKAPGPFLDPRILRQVASILYPAGTAPGAPTRQEVGRQTFTARWVGKYTIGPPRFSDRASTIHLYGTSGGSDQFLRGKFDIALFPPANPGATPTPGNPYANQVTGVAALFGQSYLQSSSMVVLDLNGTPTPGTAPDALPTQLTWTYDANSSAGPYAAPGGIVPGSGFTQGAGSLELQWTPDGHPIAGTRGSGRVILTFQGLINTSQITSPTSKFIS